MAKRLTPAQNLDLIRANTSSAAAGSWANFGAQMVTAQQAGRAAQAAESQLALQHAMAEQAKNASFAQWLQGGEHGAAFLAWRKRAVPLVHLLNERRDIWSGAWAQAISRAQAAVPAAEKQRLADLPGRLKQTAWLVIGIICFVLLPFSLFNVWGAVSSENARIVTLEEQWGYSSAAECRADDDASPFVQCEWFERSSNVVGNITWTVLFGGAGIAAFVVRKQRQKAAQNDSTVADEAQARINHFGFDPLFCDPRQPLFAWEAQENRLGYGDRLTRMITTAPTQFPDPSALLPLNIPDAQQTHPSYPQEINEALTWFAHQQQSTRP